MYDPVTGGLIVHPTRYEADWFISPTVSEIKHIIQNLNIQRVTPHIAVIQGIDVGAAHLTAQPYEIFQGASQFKV